MPHVVVVAADIVVATILLDLASGYRFPFRALLLHTLSGSPSHSLPDTLSLSPSLGLSPFTGLASLFVFGCFRVFIAKTFVQITRAIRATTTTTATRRGNHIKYVFRFYGVLICFVAENTSPRRGKTLGLGQYQIQPFSGRS